MTLETFLAKLYTQDALRQRFLDRPLETALAAGLSPDEAASMARIDRDGLVLAAESFARKRA